MRLDIKAITQERLQSLVSYDAISGDFYWRETGNKRYKGEKAGTYNKANGYTSARIDGIQYYMQRLAWIYVYGENPKYEVRFKDSNTRNFAIDNLYLYIPVDKAKTLSQERAKEVIDYDPETGYTYWKVTKGKMIAGERAGHLNIGGMRYVSVDGKSYKEHRLIWLYTYGYMPKHYIDHINCDPSDNRLENLREATAGENSQNKRKASCINKCGYLGVAYKTRKKKYTAQITVGGVTYHLGTFTDPQEAHEAYLKAKKELHPFSTL